MTKKIDKANRNRNSKGQFTNTYDKTSELTRQYTKTELEMIKEFEAKRDKNILNIIN